MAPLVCFCLLLRYISISAINLSTKKYTGSIHKHQNYMQKAFLLCILNLHKEGFKIKTPRRFRRGLFFCGVWRFLSSDINHVPIIRASLAISSGSVKKDSPEHHLPGTALILRFMLLATSALESLFNSNSFSSLRPLALSMSEGFFFAHIHKVPPF